MMPSQEFVVSLRRTMLTGLSIAAVGGVACLVGYVRVSERFYAAFLTSYLFWLGLSFGCLAISMIHGMTGGAWGLAIRRVIEAGYETLPLMAFVFLPLWHDAPLVYEWANLDIVAHSKELTRKSGYLNVHDFRWRALIYFTVWIGITRILNGVSPDDNSERESSRVRRLQKASGLGFMIYGFTFTLAIVDWAMSLEPKWYSTMYGLIHIAGQAVSGISFAVIVVVTLRQFQPWSEIVTPARLNDLGNLMLTSVMFWAYCSFFQFLIIWCGNLPEENIWYVRRSQGGWQTLAVCLFALHFAVPFLLLLSRPIKRNPISLRRIALLLLTMHYLDLCWIVIPGFQRDSHGFKVSMFHWLDIAAMLTIGGLWMAVFAWRLSIRVKLPMFDPELKDSKIERLTQPAAA